MEEEGEDITARKAFVIISCSLPGAGNPMLENLESGCRACNCWGMVIARALVVSGSTGSSTSLSDSGIKDELPGMFNRREEYSGLSIESDLSDEEEDGGGLSCCSIARGGSGSADACLEKSSRNRALTNARASS